VSGPGGPSEARVEVYPDPDAVSAAAAERIAMALATGIEARDRADWATTGGSTPVGIYRILGSPPLRDRVGWDRVHVWWGDDRFVPRDHPQSNVLALDQVLVHQAARAGLSGTGEDGIGDHAGFPPGAPIPAPNIHAMPMTAAIGEGRDVDWVAARYQEELRAAPIPADEGAFPAFDVVLVGVGADGHVLSVFPGSTVFEPGAWVAGVPAPTHIEPHLARVSLNPAFLTAARLVLVVAHGTEKASVLAEALRTERDPARWPIQHARASNAVWLLDAAAAADLPPELRRPA